MFGGIESMSNSPRLEKGPVKGPLMALFCLVVGSVVALISLSLFRWETQTGTEFAVRTLSLGAFLTLTIFSVIGVIWALFAPRWIERAVQTAYVAALASITVLLLITGCLFLYFRVTK